MHCGKRLHSNENGTEKMDIAGWQKSYKDPLLVAASFIPPDLIAVYVSYSPITENCHLLNFISILSALSKYLKIYIFYNLIVFQGTCMEI